MAQTDSESEIALRAELKRLQTGQLLRFSCECCRRISHLFTEETFFGLLEVAEHRASGSEADYLPASINDSFDRLYAKLYPGYGTPSAEALALSAIGEAACTQSPLDAAINASSTAAMALATAAAEKVTDDQYDEVHEEAFQQERQAQLKLLQRTRRSDGDAFNAEKPRRTD